MNNLLRFLLGIVCLAPICRANLVANTQASADGFFDAGEASLQQGSCGPTSSQGSTEALASIQCVVGVTQLGNVLPVLASASGQAEVGLGPFGIGLSVQTQADAWVDPGDVVNTYAQASASFSDTFTLAGGSGSGFVEFDYEIFGFFGLPFDTTGADISILGTDLSERDLQRYPQNSGLIPIQFGNIYSVSGTAYSYAGYPDTAGEPEIGSWQVTGIQFFDANGNPLGNGAIREGDVITPVPESSTLILLAFVLLAVACKRSARSRFAPHTQVF